MKKNWQPIREICYNCRCDGYNSERNLIYDYEYTIWKFVCPRCGSTSFASDEGIKRKLHEGK